MSKRKTHIFKFWYLISTSHTRFIMSLTNNHETMNFETQKFAYQSVQ